MSWHAESDVVMLTAVSYILLFIISILAIPRLVPFSLLSVAWYAEGTVFILLGLLYRENKLLQTGWLILAFGFLLFFFFDWLRDIRVAERYFIYKYSVVTICHVLILLVYLWQQHSAVESSVFGQRQVSSYFMYFTIINIWLYLLHVGSALCLTLLPQGMHFELYKLVVMILTNLLACGMVIWIPFLQDQVTRYFGILFYGCSVFILIWIDVMVPLRRRFSETVPGDYGAILLWLVLHGAVLLLGRYVYCYMRFGK